MKAVLLSGFAGAGKTALAEYIAKINSYQFSYILCHEWITAEDFFYSVDVSSIARKFAGDEIASLYSAGILARAVDRSKNKRVLVLIDEIDKASTRIDALLLDFLQNCRVNSPTGELIYGREDNIIVFLTSNGERELIDPLLRRIAKVELQPLPSQVEKKLLADDSGEFYIDKVRQFIINYITYSPVVYKNDTLQGLIVKVADRIRSAELDISLYELKQFYLHIPVCQSRRDVEILIEMWLCRTEEHKEVLQATFKSLKNLASAIWQVYREG